MRVSRKYWQSSGKLQLNYYNIDNSTVKLYIYLSVSCSRLGLKQLIITRLALVLFPKYFYLYIRNPNIQNYYKLWSYIFKYIKKWESKTVKTGHLISPNEVQSLFNYYLYSQFKVSKHSNTSYIKDVYDIHFIRMSKRYNKRRYSKVRAISRPPFWFGNLVSCICIGMFWGACANGIDWSITQPIIVDINMIIIFLYFIVIIRFISISLSLRLKNTRSYWGILRGKIYIFYYKFTKKIKWFK